MISTHRHTTLLPFRRYAKSDTVTHCDTRLYNKIAVRMPASKVALWSKNRVKSAPLNLFSRFIYVRPQVANDTSKQVKG